MKNSKKLLAAVAALVVALAVSVGSTFAWFTTNKNVTVEGIQANVTSGDSNLEVAFVWDEQTAAPTGHAVGEIGDFGYSINLNDYLAEILEHTKFDALTDKGEVEDTDPVEYAESWETTNGYTLTDKLGNDAIAASKTSGTTETWIEGNYLTFTLRFRTTSATAESNGIQMNLLEDRSSVTSTKVEGKYPDIWGWDWTIPAEKEGDDPTDNWKTYFADKSLGEGKKMEADAMHAVRVAFHEASVTVPQSETDTTDAVKGEVEVDGTKGKVWDPYAYDAVTANNKATGTWSNYTAKNMAQLIEEHITGALAGSLDDMYEDPQYAVQKTGAEVAKLVKKDTEYYQADIKFYIWIEGTDADCFNNIFGDLINIQLGFGLVLE